MIDKISKDCKHEGVTKEKIQPIHKTNDFALYNNDCIEVMTSYPDNYIDMIFADPPYNLSNGGFTCQAGKMVSVNKGEWDKSRGFEMDLEFRAKLGNRNKIFWRYIETV